MTGCAVSVFSEWPRCALVIRGQLPLAGWSNVTHYSLSGFLSSVLAESRTSLVASLAVTSPRVTSYVPVSQNAAPETGLALRSRLKFFCFFFFTSLCLCVMVLWEIYAQK